MLRIRAQNSQEKYLKRKFFCVLSIARYPPAGIGKKFRKKRDRNNTRTS